VKPLSYKIYKQGEIKPKEKNSYLYADLIEMNNYQLREIAQKEQLVKNAVYDLPREELIRLIMRFRGKAEVSLITKFSESGIEGINKMFEVFGRPLLGESRLVFPARINVYEDLAVDYFDRYYVSGEIPPEEGNVLLVDEYDSICGIFNLKKAINGIYYLAKSQEMKIIDSKSRKYSLLYFTGNSSEAIYRAYYGMDIDVVHHNRVTCERIALLEFKELQRNIALAPLVIDFGANNTITGTILDNKSHKFVKYMNVVTIEETYIIPSSIGIKNIENDKLEYSFGYESSDIFSKNYLAKDTAIFLNIKEWISDIDKKEQISNSEGFLVEISRKEMLIEYFEYLVTQARTQFKTDFSNIVLIVPMRLEYKYKKVFDEILTKYAPKYVSEVRAALFNSVKKLMESNSYKEGYEYKSLIFDCGGSNTYASSNKFVIESNRVSYKIKTNILCEKTEHEFGGNNLTYHILKLLQLKLTETTNYEEAEKLLPTHYGNINNSGAEHYFKVKKNYYYLWEMAEKIKNKFSEENRLQTLVLNSSTVSNSLTKKEYENTKYEREVKLYIDKWKLYFTSSKIETVLSCVIYRDEIRDVLFEDVEKIVKIVFEDKYINQELMKYNIVNILGQSTISELFYEAIKEYLPGRKIQNLAKNKNTKALKSGVIEGTLFYLENVKNGHIEVLEEKADTLIPYELYAYTHDEIKMTLSKSYSKKNEVGMISRYMDCEYIDIYMKNPQGKELKTYRYENTGELRKVHYEQIKEIYPKEIIQDEVDNLLDRETKFFIWSSAVEWGFYIMPIIRMDSILYTRDVKFFEFEDGSWEKNFFDGDN
jgi:hypothetical protein